MGCELSQLLLLVRGQIRFDVLCVAPHQVNAGGDHDIEISSSPFFKPPKPMY
jgi:hypothetical protein